MLALISYATVKEHLRVCDHGNFLTSFGFLDGGGRWIRDAREVFSQDGPDRPDSSVLTAAALPPNPIVCIQSCCFKTGQTQRHGPLSCQRLHKDPCWWSCMSGIIWHTSTTPTPTPTNLLEFRGKIWKLQLQVTSQAQIHNTKHNQ